MTEAETNSEQTATSQSYTQRPDTWFPAANVSQTSVGSDLLEDEVGDAWDEGFNVGWDEGFKAGGIMAAFDLGVSVGQDNVSLPDRLQAQLDARARRKGVV